MVAGGPLEQLQDFSIGPVRVRPASRSIEGASGTVTTEPLVMQLLVELSRNAGRMVTRRDIFERCWGSCAVGDDSLNRVVAALRKAVHAAADGIIQIDTVPGAGYTLRLVPERLERGAASETGQVEEAIAAGRDSIRLGMPEPDYLRLELLRRAVAGDEGNADAWGMLSLLCRYAAEYCEPGEIADLVAECQASARRALRLKARQACALVALATVAPLFGRWLQARTELMRVLHAAPDEFVVHHELVIADMATGRVGAAVSRNDRLIANDPLAACVMYKGIYQHWSAGDLVGMDQLGDRAIQLWPTHPAIWTARFWTLAYTGRAEAALAMVEDPVRPPIPQPMLQLLRAAASAVVQGSDGAHDQAALVARQAAASGPARAIAALFTLGLLRRVDEAFVVAHAYYLREGAGPVPVRHTTGEPSINDQHRRVTQILFTPACADMRQDPRFLPLCERAGLASYWEQTGLVPDFLA